MTSSNTRLAVNIYLLFAEVLFLFGGNQLEEVRGASKDETAVVTATAGPLWQAECINTQFVIARPVAESASLT